MVSLLQEINNGAMEEFILFTTNIEGICREVRIYPVISSPNQYLIHWDGFEIGMIKKMDDKWYTSSVPLLDVVNQIGAFIEKKRFGDEGVLNIEGRNLTVFKAGEKGCYDVSWDGLKIGYVVASINLETNGNKIWVGSIALLNLHAQTIGQYILDNNL
jgi:hypothetical protein